MTSSLDSGFVAKFNFQQNSKNPLIPYVILYRNLKRFCLVYVDHKLSYSFYKFKIKGEEKFNNFASLCLYKSQTQITFCMLAEKIAQGFNLIPRADMIKLRMKDSIIKMPSCKKMESQYFDSFAMALPHHQTIFSKRKKKYLWYNEGFHLAISQ